jgi:hypothetical protein
MERSAGFDYGRDTFDGGRGFDGTAAEFHYDHERTGMEMRLPAASVRARRNAAGSRISLSLELRISRGGLPNA